MPLKLAKGRGTIATCVAVVFAACRLERLPRSFKEILAIIPEADQKKASLPSQALHPELEVRCEDLQPQAGDCRAWCCSQLSSDLNLQPIADQWQLLWVKYTPNLHAQPAWLC